jgi:hypothetical protein
MVALCLGCSLRDERVTETNVRAIAARVANGEGDLSEADRQQFAEFARNWQLTVAQGSDAGPLNRTVIEIITAARADAERRATARAAQAAEEERADNVRWAAEQAERNRQQAAAEAAEAEQRRLDARRR